MVGRNEVRAGDGLSLYRLAEDARLYYSRAMAARICIWLLDTSAVPNLMEYMNGANDKVIWKVYTNENPLPILSSVSTMKLAAPT